MSLFSFLNPKQPELTGPLTREKIREAIFWANGSPDHNMERIVVSVWNYALEQAAENVDFADKGDSEYDYDYPVISKQSILKLKIQ